MWSIRVRCVPTPPDLKPGVSAFALTIPADDISADDVGELLRGKCPEMINELVANQTDLNLTVTSYEAFITGAPDFTFDAASVLDGVAEQLAATTDVEDHPDDEDQVIASVGLGSIFVIYPSGKFYMPWACSNLKRCPICEGGGNVPNVHHHPERLARAKAMRLRVTTRAMPHGLFYQWPTLYQKIARMVDQHVEDLSEIRRCPYCGGVGSREAYEDEIAREALEAYAEEHGFFIEGNEGDPTFLMAITSRPKEIHAES